MSQWLHVAGVVRIDNLRVSLTEGPNWDYLFGKEWHMDREWNSVRASRSDCEEHPETYMPFGCEGTLMKYIFEDPNIDNLSAYTVTIFGDLRDPEMTAKQVITWFKEKCSNIRTLRQATITIIDTHEKEPLCWWTDGNL